MKHMCTLSVSYLLWEEFSTSVALMWHLYARRVRHLERAAISMHALSLAMWQFQCTLESKLTGFVLGHVACDYLAAPLVTCILQAYLRVVLEASHGLTYLLFRLHSLIACMCRFLTHLESLSTSYFGRTHLSRTCNNFDASHDECAYKTTLVALISCTAVAIPTPLCASLCAFLVTP